MTQEEAFDILKLGRNVYLTGSAGSGKTFLLNKYIDYLKKNKIEAGITASTGIAATHMNGRTIHSWSGLGVKDNLTDAD
ncbi:MAG: AAA family ATPase, partial [bacterium]